MLSPIKPRPGVPGDEERYKRDVVEYHKKYGYTPPAEYLHLITGRDAKPKRN